MKFPACVSALARVSVRSAGDPGRRGRGGCGSSGAEGALKITVSECELGLVGTSRCDSEVNATYAGAHLRAKLEQFEANGLCRGIGELGMCWSTRRNVSTST